ncbi:hypothetical protein [Effusibacillus lacus]|uniref:hypothetical protein n=1 Tax=Effusibacillus lacus TaxID=1348429 RepID=UPI000BB7ED8C|nr:hypothetical protein [Effusibacillus lacus]TCS66667.1 hypothetical protein EDD64_1604 [Effusibacillus lacus]
MNKKALTVIVVTSALTLSSVSAFAAAPSKNTKQQDPPQKVQWTTGPKEPGQVTPEYFGTVCGGTTDIFKISDRFGTTIYSYGETQCARPVDIIGVANYLYQGGSLIAQNADQQTLATMAYANNSKNYDSTKSYYSDSNHYTNDFGYVDTAYTKDTEY